MDIIVEHSLESNVNEDSDMLDVRHYETNLLKIFHSFAVNSEDILEDAVRPSLVPMRDLVHTINGARVDSGTGRTGARREDGAWDLGKRR